MSMPTWLLTTNHVADKAKPHPSDIMVEGEYCFCIINCNSFSESHAWSGFYSQLNEKTYFVEHKTNRLIHTSSNLRE